MLGRVVLIWRSSMIFFDRLQIFGLLYVAVVVPGSPTGSAPFMRSEDDTYSSQSIDHSSSSARLGMASPALRSWAGLTPMSEFGGSTQSGQLINCSLLLALG